MSARRDFVRNIVVATYRRDVALKNALESLSTQTYDDFEIVLVDDNAMPEWNDKVNCIVDDFKNQHPNVAIYLLLRTLRLAEKHNVASFFFLLYRRAYT